MSDPQRLSDHGGSDVEIALLRSARHDAPPPESRRRTLVALGVAGSATAAASAAAAATAAGSSGAGGMALWIGGGVALGLATVGALGILPSSPPREPPRAVAPASVERSAAPVPIAREHGAAAPAEVPAATSSAEPPREEASGRAATSRPAPGSLTDEVAALDAAREALSGGDAARALAAVDEHDRRFPGGTLGPEATVVRIEALALRGDRAAAARMAGAFLAAHPRSPHADHLRSLLGLAAPAPSVP